MHRNARWVLIMCLWLAVAMTLTTAPVYSAGSVLDTISQTETEGQAGGDLSIEQTEAPATAPGQEALAPEPVEPAAEEPAPAEPSPAPAQPKQILMQQTCTPISAAQFQQYIQNLIRAILSKLGFGCSGGRIIIIRIPTSGCPNTGTQPAPQPQPVPQPSPQPVPQPAPQPTPSTGTSTGTGTTGGVSSIAGLKAEMKGKYGINAVDGDAAWSQRQLEEANKVLANLPEGFRSCTKNIQRDGVFQSPGVLGYVQMGIPTVHLMNSCCSQGTFQGTLVHEMTHTFQASHPDITQAWSNRFWPNGRYGGPRSSSVSSYGNTQPVEDFAESVRAYFQNGPRMKAAYPDRYEFVKTYVMSGREY